MLAIRRKKTSSILGIDINSTSVKIVEISCTQGQYCIEGYGHTALSQNPMDSSVVLTQIKALLVSENLSSKKAVIAVPNVAIISKVIQMNACIQEQDIEEWVWMEAGKYIPYPLDEISLDFNLLGASSNHSERLDILVVACRTENVEQRVELIRSAGLVVKIVDVESYAIERAMHFFNVNPNMIFSAKVKRECFEKDTPMLLMACGLALHGLRAAV